MESRLLRLAPSGLLLVLATAQIFIGAASASLLARSLDHPSLLISPAGYVSLIWPVVFVTSLASAVYLLAPARGSTYSGIFLPLSLAYGLFLLWLVSVAREWLPARVLILAVMLSLLWRAFAVVSRERHHAPRNDQLLIMTPIAIYTGWISTLLFIDIAIALWERAPQTGSLSTVWQVAVIMFALLAVCAGVESSRAHIAYAVSALWALSAVAIGTYGSENRVLIGFSIGAIVVVVALFFTERAMTRYRGRHAQLSVR
jgi:hypothetical protein